MTTEMKEKICSKCGKEIEGFPCHHPLTKKEICQACYRRANLNSTIFRIRRPKERRTGKKPGRKPKYPSREAIIATLEERESGGKDNFPSTLFSEDLALYRSTFRFEVELPRRGCSYDGYCLGDSVENRNEKDPYVCGRIGKVVFVSEKSVKVNFGEPGRIIRVYEKWYNLNNIKKVEP